MAKQKCWCYSGEETSCGECGKKYITITPKEYKELKKKSKAYDKAFHPTKEQLKNV